MRQLALAESLRDEGASVEFACRKAGGYSKELVSARRFPVHELADASGDAESLDAETTHHMAGSGFDWVVVDHYELGSAWERLARAFARRILAVDDLADRMHECDVVVDQNLYEGIEHRYDGLVPEDCLRLLGPAYALLRREFLEARRNLLARRGSVHRLHVSLGGTDRQGKPCPRSRQPAASLRPAWT